MSEFASAFLCNPYPEPVEMYVIPALAQDMNRKFPFLALIRSLRNETRFNNSKVINDSWLLHSILSLEPPDFGKIFIINK